VKFCHSLILIQASISTDRCGGPSSHQKKSYVKSQLNLLQPIVLSSVKIYSSSNGLLAAGGTATYLPTNDAFIVGGKG